jgi:hypothetical protein
MRGISSSSTQLFLHQARSSSLLLHRTTELSLAEIMLLGTGKRILQPPPFIRKYLNERGIQLDVLDTVSTLPRPRRPSFIMPPPHPRETPARPTTSSQKRADASQPPSSPYPPAPGRSPQSRRHNPTQNIRSSNRRSIVIVIRFRRGSQTAGLALWCLISKRQLKT